MAGSRAPLLVSAAVAGLARERPSAPDRAMLLTFDEPDLPFLCRSRPYPSVHAALPELPARTAATVWLDVHDPTEDDMQRLAQRFNLHRVSVIGILSEVLSERLELFDHYVQLSMEVSSYDSDRLDDEKLGHGGPGGPGHRHGSSSGHIVTFIFFRRVLITLHRRALAEIRQCMAEYHFAAAERHLTEDDHDDATGIAAYTAGVEAFHPSPPTFFLDVLQHFVTACAISLPQVEDKVEQLQKAAMEEAESSRRDILLQMNAVRQDLVVFQRRMVRKQQLLQDAMVGRSALLVAGEALPRLQACSEELHELVGHLTSIKDALASAQSNFLSNVSIDMALVAQATSESVNMFTVTMTLALPITGISGLLGMNIYYPGTYGFESPNELLIGPFATAIAFMIVLPLLMWFVFWKLGRLRDL